MRILTVILILLLCNFIDAQDISDNAIRKNEIGFDLANIFRPTSDFISGEANDYYIHYPYNFLYKRHLENYSLVLGFGGLWSKGSPYFSDTSEFNIMKYSIGFNIGIEKNINLNNRWQFIYGGSLFFRKYNESTNMYVNDVFDYECNTQESECGFYPKLGFHYKISNRFSLFAFTRIMLYYSVGKVDDKGNSPAGPNKTYSSYNASFWEIAKLFVCYEF